MPEAHNCDTTLYYETHGAAADPAMLLIMGLSAQMTLWPDEFIDRLVAEGFFVVAFDNRDVGLSSKTTGDAPSLEAFMLAVMTGAPAPTVPYLLSDMADDACAVLDDAGVESAHVCGASMGGMIAQTMAIEHPSRVRSLCSIMSTTGDLSVGQADPAVAIRLAVPPALTRDEAISNSVAMWELISGPHFDAAAQQEYSAGAFDRAFHPHGQAFQLAAVLASGDRTAGLGSVTAPTLVVHGRLDPLIGVTGGEATAAAVPGSKLVVFEEMGHDLPRIYWDELVAELTANAARAS